MAPSPSATQCPTSRAASAGVWRSGSFVLCRRSWPHAAVPRLTTRTGSETCVPAASVFAGAARTAPSGSPVTRTSIVGSSAWVGFVVRDAVAVVEGDRQPIATGRRRQVHAHREVRLADLECGRRDERARLLRGDEIERGGWALREQEGRLRCGRGRRPGPGHDIDRIPADAGLEHLGQAAPVADLERHLQVRLAADAGRVH